MMKILLAACVAVASACVGDAPQEGQITSNLCTMQDQIDGVCVGPYTEVWEATLTYTSQQGVDPYSRVWAACDRSMSGRYSCSLFIDNVVPFCQHFAVACWEREDHDRTVVCESFCTND